MDTVFIEPYDEVYSLVTSTDLGIVEELRNYFTFEVPNAKFTPKFKAKVWDGKCRLYNRLTGKLYKGLIPYVEKFCQDRNYKIIKHNSIVKYENTFNVEEFIPTLKLSLTPYDEQKIAITHAIQAERCVLVSPTASGKSCIIYALTRYFLENIDKKILIVVPSINLVDQLFSDFKDYSSHFNVEENVHKIYSGHEKISDKRIFISTWQSIYKLKESFFNQFEVIMCDEAHGLKADALKGIFENSYNAIYRIGLTGTLDKTECHRLTIEGLTGPAFVVTTTDKMIKQGKSSSLEIICTILKYSDSVKKDCKKFTYQDEIDFIVNNSTRNKFIANITNTIPLDKNVLILTARKSHIVLLNEYLQKYSKRKTIIVTGDTEAEIREEIRKLAEIESGINILATYGVYSTGVNIKNLQYIIKATPSKSMVRVLQSIGRGLRKDGKFNMLKVIDIIDDFSYKNKKNFLYQHFIERVKIYTSQKFTYKIKHINI
jgi:superfamily II DNA or RNA helicase